MGTPMKSARIRRLWLVGLAAWLIPAAVRAATDVGTIVSLVGTLEVERASGAAVEPGAVGTVLYAGDVVRSGRDTRAKLLFRGDHVVDVAASTRLTVEQMEADPESRRYVGVLRLANGKVHVVVNDEGGQATGRFEVETPTAVAGQKGTEFVVLYNAVKGYTDVVGVGPTVEVQGILAMIGPSATVGRREFSRVGQGRFPSAPRPVEAALFTQYLGGFDIMGTGSRESLDTVHPASSGRVLRPEDLPELVSKPPAAPVAEMDLDVGARVAVEPLPERLFPDLRGSDQPIPEFEDVVPGDRPSGGVGVDF
jgi:hypothetical protein